MVCVVIVHLQSSSAEKLAQTYTFIPVKELLRRKHDAVLCTQKNSRFYSHPESLCELCLICILYIPEK